MSAKRYAYQHGDHFAFYLDRRPRSGDLLESAGVTFLSGEKPREGSLFACGECHEYLGTPMTRYVVEVA